MLGIYEPVIYLSYVSYHLAPEYLAYQGCWIDSPSDRDLPQEVTDISYPSSCVIACKTRGLMYAGVQRVGTLKRHFQNILRKMIHT